MNASCSTQKNLYCSSTGDTAGRCSCNPTYYYDTVSSSCIVKKTNDAACTVSNECRSDLGLRCGGASLCACATGYYWSYISYMCS